MKEIIELEHSHSNRRVTTSSETTQEWTTDSEQTVLLLIFQRFASDLLVGNQPKRLSTRNNMIRAKCGISKMAGIPHFALVNHANDVSANLLRMMNSRNECPVVSRLLCLLLLLLYGLQYCKISRWITVRRLFSVYRVLFSNETPNIATDSSRWSFFERRTLFTLCSDVSRGPAVETAWPVVASHVREHKWPMNSKVKDYGHLRKNP